MVLLSFIKYVCLFTSTTSTDLILVKLCTHGFREFKPENKIKVKTTFNINVLKINIYKRDLFIFTYLVFIFGWVKTTECRVKAYLKATRLSHCVKYLLLEHSTEWLNIYTKQTCNTCGCWSKWIVSSEVVSSAWHIHEVTRYSGKADM